MIAPALAQTTPLAACVSTTVSRPQWPVLIVVEGNNDIAFLKSIAAVWRRADPRLPDLTTYELQRQIAFVPIGGGGASDITAWAQRLDALSLPRFHLHDREEWPETGRRLTAVAAIDRQPNRCGRITSKRSLENYLHPAAIVAAGGPEVAVGNHNDVAACVAAARLAGAAPDVRWSDLTLRSQRRLVGRAKRWLNAVVVAGMTPQQAAQRDPDGEVAGWLRDIDELVRW